MFTPKFSKLAYGISLALLPVLVIGLPRESAAERSLGVLARVAPLTGIAVFSSEKYDDVILTQDVLDKHYGLMAEAAVIIDNRHRLGLYGSLGSVTYECAGQEFYVKRTSTSDQPDTTVQDDCSGLYKRLGVKYEYSLPLDKEWDLRFGVGSGYHWQTNNMTVVRTAPRSYEDSTQVRISELVHHRREGQELFMLEVGIERATGALNIGPVLMLTFDRDEAFSSSGISLAPKGLDSGPTGIGHAWVFAGFGLSYCSRC